MVGKTIAKLLNRADSTNLKYEEALEKNHSKLIEMQDTLNYEKVKLEEFHKMFILQEITGESYLEQKELVEGIRKEMIDLQEESTLIEKYKTDDIDKIIKEIEKEKPEFNKVQQEEINKLKTELAEAKQTYLATVSKIGKTYDNVVKSDNLFQDMLVRLGKQKSIYTPNKHEILHGIGTVTDADIQQNL